MSVRNSKHLVESVHFEPGQLDGPLVCKCGESMMASTFQMHRLENGEKVTGPLRPPKGYSDDWSKYHTKHT